MFEQNYMFQVPDNKKIRVIVHADAKNEADDQFAICHHLMSPREMIVGIVAGHFEKNPRKYEEMYPEGGTAHASFLEIEKVVDLMGLTGQVRIAEGSAHSMPDEKTPMPSAGAQLIIDEAMKDDPHELYVVCQGTLTDVASAILMEPRIQERMTVVWIGGGIYPVGGQEFNLMMDINAANVVFSSKVSLWQVPMDVYKQVAVSLAELQVNVEPYGKIGHYLVQQMVDFNNEFSFFQRWPHGESWGLGDQGTVTVLLEEYERFNWNWVPAPRFDPRSMNYIHNQNNRPIRVYHTLDSRMTLGDFYAKLKLNFPERDS